ncbi:two-component system regulatory protein YycI [Virgibacillus necropolis]|uniref:Regulatory protein YycH-like domain-containing protein n=1 Tax=Virgibacillus necropolis TaxID=163877 RepID=A0A221M873_9BACI|nr:two-component system regulatory protein YycI [Virgibacillus necropolis]ASN03825.1 hypothetical protein CFK40_01810 [Virgibacillus necropolis]
MQWSQIKTLFILCFLVLDVYLLIQFSQKQDKEENDVSKQEQAATIEENLRAENIKISANLSGEDLKGSYISVKKQLFTEESSKTVKAAENQETAIIDKEFIISRLKEPAKIQEDATEDEITELVKSKLTLISPDSYVFWDWNKELNMLVFFQKKNDRPIYFNPNGIIFVFLNDKNEIDFYTQTLLGEVEEQESQKLLSKPIEAIKVLFQRNELNPDEEVTKADIGYYTRLPLENVTQVFAPTWKITVDNEMNYFVNALEGTVFSSNDVEFLIKSVSTIVSKVNQIDNNPDLKKYLLNQLTNRLEAINRSESE